jgi:hypothetical protein
LLYRPPRSRSHEVSRGLARPVRIRVAVTIEISKSSISRIRAISLLSRETQDRGALIARVICVELCCTVLSPAAIEVSRDLYEFESRSRSKSYKV